MLPSDLVANAEPVSAGGVHAHAACGSIPVHFPCEALLPQGGKNPRLRSVEDLMSSRSGSAHLYKRQISPAAEVRSFETP